MFGAAVGFVGYGQIAREIHRLLRPFGVKVQAFDPWLSEEVARNEGVEPVNLDELMGRARCLFVTAVPTKENKGLLDGHSLSLLQNGALVVLVSRAHLIDFDALIDEVTSGRLKAAIDVFPTEPFAAGHALRGLPNVILSPHRAAAVAEGRHLIGELILEDLRAMKVGAEPANLQRAKGLSIELLAGTGNASEVENMAGQRK